MKKFEAKSTTQLRAWMKQACSAPAAIELKNTRGKSSFTMSELKDKQLRWLMSAMGPDPVPYKLPDHGGVQPCDVVIFGMMYAYIIITYPTFSVCILPEKFEREKKLMVKSGEKTLSASRAKEIACSVLQGKKTKV